MFVRTDRLLLRPGWREDAPALHAAIADWRIVRNLARAPWPYRLQDAEHHLAAEPVRALPEFLIFLRSGDAPELIGGIGLAPLGAEIELGYWIKPDRWGQGFASEAGAAVVRLADALRLPALVSGHFVDNPGSGAVLRKLGFRPTGLVAPRFSAARGRDVACVLFERRFATRRRQEQPPLAA